MPDKITLTGDKMTIETDEGRKVERKAADVVDMFQKEFSLPMEGAAYPDGTKFIDYREPLLIVAHQQPPHMRNLRWIAKDSPRQYGSGTKYRKVRLSFPYTMTLATFTKSGKHIVNYGRNELYFSNVP